MGNSIEDIAFDRRVGFNMGEVMWEPTPWWRSHGYLAGKEIGNGLWLCVAPMLFTWRLMVCDEGSVHEFWCYPKEKFAPETVIKYMNEYVYDLQSDPHEGWVKHHPSHRRPGDELEPV